MPRRFPKPTGEGNAGADPGRPELLDVGQVAERLNCSARSVYRLADDGRMPPPVKLGSLVRWRADELAQWIDGGCPSVVAGKNHSRRDDHERGGRSHAK